MAVKKCIEEDESKKDENIEAVKLYVRSTYDGRCSPNAVKKAKSWTELCEHMNKYCVWDKNDTRGLRALVETVDIFKEEKEFLLIKIRELQKFSLWVLCDRRCTSNSLKKTLPSDIVLYCLKRHQVPFLLFGQWRPFVVLRTCASRGYLLMLKKQDVCIYLCPYPPIVKWNATIIQQLLSFQFLNSLFLVKTCATQIIPRIEFIRVLCRYKYKVPLKLSSSWLYILEFNLVSHFSSCIMIIVLFIRVAGFRWLQLIVAHLLLDYFYFFLIFAD